MKEINKKKIIIASILFLLIVLISIYKVVYPKIEQENKINNKILTCKASNIEGYDTVYKTTYKNKEIEKIQVTFTKVEETANNTTNQMDYLCMLNENEYHYLNENLIVTLTKKTLNNNKNDTNLKKMFKKYDKAKKYYQELGYSCA